jgi:hypothetical protein
MDIDAAMRELWGEPSPQLPQFCPFAEQFHTWAVDLIASLERERSSPQACLLAIYKAKVAVLDRYLAWRSYVPRVHRDRLNSKTHLCIYGVFLDTCSRIQLIELSLPPLPLFLLQPQAPVPAPPIPQIAGIMLGEMEEDDDT